MASVAICVPWTTRGHFIRNLFDFVITKLGSVCYFGTIYGEYTSAAKVPPEKTNSHESGF